ncbi:MAG: HU family DNA-binding protein [Prevotella sp.]|jgi:nucleoid DNA-binding protein|nr:HU family DNA-binding protein [Prevotella sp.]
MDERLSLQDLIDLLVKKQGITRKDAEAFLREFIAVVTENIEANEPVKIKDFGTFKPVKVNARKSVDVNTGETIEIAAHYKLSFNPDRLLKEAINRPFAHFESVVLEEGVTFDNIESEIEEEKGGEVEEDATIEEEITGYIAVESPKAGMSEEEVVEELAGEAVEPEPEKEAEKSGQEAAPPDDIISKIEEEAALRNVNIEDFLVALREDDKEEKTLAGKAAEDEPGFEYEADGLVYEDTAPERKGIRKRYITLAFFIFLIIAGFVAGGLYFQEIAAYLTQGSSGSDNNMAIAVEPQAMVTVADSLVQEQDTISDSQAPNPLLQDRGRDMQAPPPSPQVKQAETVTPQTSVNAPLGVETIQPGHTLRNIALKYYGNKSFWVYIYEENKGKIKNINNVPIGTKLTIPAPAKYGIDPQDKASVTKARAQEEVLFKRADITPARADL